MFFVLFVFVFLSCLFVFSIWECLGNDAQESADKYHEDDGHTQKKRRYCFPLFLFFPLSNDMFCSKRATGMIISKPNRNNAKLSLQIKLGNRNKAKLSLQIKLGLPRKHFKYQDSIREKSFEGQKERGFENVFCSLSLSLSYFFYFSLFVPPKRFGIDYGEDITIKIY